MFTKTSGIILTIAGIVMIAYSGFTYYTTEKVVDLGALQINKQKEHFVQWPPIVGVVLLVGGVVILLRSNKTNA